MTLQQLRYLCEIAHQGLRLSQAAAVLHTSQPGVSKQIKSLEDELGIVIFRRKRNRILGLTQPGKEIVRYAECVLLEAKNLRRFRDDFLDQESGNLVIASTHTHARYTLPRIVSEFTSKFPRVRLEFWHGNRDEIFRWVESGEADIAIGTDSDVKFARVAMVPYEKLHRIVVTKPGHPLLREKPVTLEKIAKYPLITYGFKSNKRWKLRHIFEARKCEPNIIFSAVDADVSKAYVELGMGIAILPHVTYDASRDTALRAIDVRHLFESEVMQVGLNKGNFVRKCMFEFLAMLSPNLTRNRVERALFSKGDPKPKLKT